MEIVPNRPELTKHTFWTCPNRIGFLFVEHIDLHDFSTCSNIFDFITINMGPIWINIGLGHPAWDMGPWAHMGPYPRQGVLGLIQIGPILIFILIYIYIYIYIYIPIDAGQPLRANYTSIYIGVRDLPLRDMLSLGAWRMGLGCSAEILPSSSPSPSSPEGSDLVPS